MTSLCCGESSEAWSQTFLRWIMNKFTVCCMSPPPPGPLCSPPLKSALCYHVKVLKHCSICNLTDKPDAGVFSLASKLDANEHAFISLEWHRFSRCVTGRKHAAA